VGWGGLSGMIHDFLAVNTIATIHMSALTGSFSNQVYDTGILLQQRVTPLSPPIISKCTPLRIHTFRLVSLLQSPKHRLPPSHLSLPHSNLQTFFNHRHRRCQCQYQRPFAFARDCTLARSYTFFGAGRAAAALPLPVVL
jgi:hypothetical protein